LSRQSSSRKEIADFSRVVPPDNFHVRDCGFFSRVTPPPENFHTRNFYMVLSSVKISKQEIVDLIWVVPQDYFQVRARRFSMVDSLHNTPIPSDIIEVADCGIF
jgi:hypothetical protein